MYSRQGGTLTLLAAMPFLQWLHRRSPILDSMGRRSGLQHTSHSDMKRPWGFPTRAQCSTTSQWLPSTRKKRGTADVVAAWRCWGSRSVRQPSPRRASTLPSPRVRNRRRAHTATTHTHVSQPHNQQRFSLVTRTHTGQTTAHYPIGCIGEGGCSGNYTKN